MLKQLEMSNNKKLFPGTEAGREGTVLVPSTESSGYGKELPDKSHSRGATQTMGRYCQSGRGWWGSKQGRNTLISLFSYPLISCHYFPLAEHCREPEPKESK